MNFAQLEPEEKLLVARIQDLARIAAQRGGSRFSSFLNERQQLVAQELIRRDRLENTLFFGGYSGAVRCMLGVFPEWQTPEEAVYPIAAVTVHLPKNTVVSHRDVLGSLMALRIERETIGDILFAERRCEILVQEIIAPLIVDELHKVGRTGVRCELGILNNYHREDHFQELRATVHSARLDALVSAMTGISREKGAALIRAESVQQNYQTARSGSAAFAAGDVVTVRGYGKYKVDAIGTPTKKGRLPVQILKYI